MKFPTTFSSNTSTTSSGNTSVRLNELSANLQTQLTSSEEILGMASELTEIASRTQGPDQQKLLKIADRLAGSAQKIIITSKRLVDAI